MKKTIAILGLLLVAAASFFMNSCGPNSGYNLPAGDSCLASTTWFPHSQTPAPNETDTSLFSNDCDFHKWSWQKFLYLTQNDSTTGKARFEGLLQVDNQMKPLGTTLILDDHTQAGGAATIYDKNNHPIYYAIYMNQQMYDFAVAKINLIKALPITQDTVSNAAMSAAGYDTLTYPVGSFEVKTSWIVTSTLAADSANYYVTSALLNGVSTRVALVGMHIIGRVVNHPEFIWATYEHSNLAPTVTWPSNYVTDSMPDSTQAISQNDYLFYKAGERMKGMNIRRDSTDTSKTFFSTYRLFENGTQPKYAGMIASLATKDSSNLISIKQINASVYSVLAKENDLWKNYAYVGSVWIDPKVATLQPGDANIGALNRMNLRGSRALSNISMETCEQLEWNFPNANPFETGNTVAYNSMNCFGCHASVSFKGFNGSGLSTNLALSHLFNNNLKDTLAAIGARNAARTTKKVTK